PPLRPAAFFWAVVPPWLADEREEPECDFLPPRLEAPGEFAIRAARSLDIPFSLSFSYCFSFLTFARLLGMRRSFGACAGTFSPARSGQTIGRRATLWTMESRGDAWESAGWEAAWQQPAEDPDRDQVLELARRLAEQHRRQSAEALVEVEDLKRALRERAADVARRELEVERRTRELDAQGDSEGKRALRLRRPERHRANDADRAYAEELLSRREAELQQRLVALVPREREIKEREAAHRARELEIEEAAAGLARRKEELQTASTRLRTRERELEASRAEISRTTDDLVRRAAALEAAEQELAAERRRLQLESSVLEQLRQELDPGGERQADDGAREVAAQAHDLVLRAKELDELERQLAAR